MNQYGNSAGSVLAQPIPLFNSSWMALFVVIRHSLSGRHDDARIDAVRARFLRNRSRDD